MGQETRAMDIRLVEICPFGLRVGERMISACVVPTVKHGGGGVMGVWALLVTLSVIYLEFKARLTSMATTAFCSDTPSHLV